MANTIDKTTNDALLRSIIDGSITEFEDDVVEGILPSYKFYNCTNLEKVDIKNIKRIYKEAFNNCSSLRIGKFPSVISIGHSAFKNCTNLKSLDVSNVRQEGNVNNDDNSVNMYIFQNCTNLKSLHFDKLEYTEGGNRPFTYNSGTEIVVLPSIGIFKNGNFISCPMKKLDIGKKVSLFTDSGYNVASSYFEALIIRAEVVAPLDHANLLGNSYFANDSTKGQSGKNSTYKIYVPQSLISEYQAATNWSAYSTFFEPIEGSPYEHYWADGVPIGLEHPYGLIGYYAVGDSSKYEAITNISGHINSTVDSELMAYAMNNPIPGAVASTTSVKPSVFYSGYCSQGNGLGIYCENAIMGDGDVITIEYSIAKNIDTHYVSAEVWGTLKSSPQSSDGITVIFNNDWPTYEAGINRKYIHKLIIIQKDGSYDVYMNGVLKRSRKTNSMANVNYLGIGQNSSANCYLGPVAIYNRALSSEEIAQHYQWYVDNYNVGKVAFDSSGNFVGACPAEFSPNGLIGYYEVGNENNYEAITNVPSHINSSVNSDLVAYTSNRSNPGNGSTSSSSKIPDTVYNGYAKYRDLCIFSPAGNFLSDCDVITVEFGNTAINNNDPYIYPVYFCSHKNSITDVGDTLIQQNDYRAGDGTTERMFIHKLLEFHKDGTIKFYVNGNNVDNRTVDSSTINNINWIGIGHAANTTAYLGPVAIYNRALSSDEIATHYQYYVDNYMVGQTAYDSNGNFIVGFPSGLSTDSAIGFYDVGDESKYEGIHDFPTHIDSIIQNDSVVGYGGAGYWNDPRVHITPYLFEDGFAVNESYGFGVGCNFYCIDNTFSSLYDVVTIEYVYAGSRGSQAGPLIYGKNKSSFTNSGSQTWSCNESWSYTNGDKEFRHYLVEIHSDGTVKRYINGVAKANQTITTPLNVNCITIGQTDSFAISAIGPVVVYSRALTSEEIAQHYQWYVTNYRVGELAFDSSGNFIPTQSS